MRPPGLGRTGPSYPPLCVCVGGIGAGLGRRRLLRSSLSVSLTRSTSSYSQSGPSYRDSNLRMAYAGRYAARQVYGTYSVRVPGPRVRYVPGASQNIQNFNINNINNKMSCVMAVQCVSAGWCSRCAGGRVQWPANLMLSAGVAQPLGTAHRHLAIVTAAQAAAAAVAAIASVGLPPSARVRPPGPKRPCEQRQQQRRRPWRCSCSAGAPVQREAARAPGSTATSTRTAARHLSAALRHEAALGRRSQRGEALNGDAAAAAVSARAAIAREKWTSSASVGRAARAAHAPRARQAPTLPTYYL